LFNAPTVSDQTLRGITIIAVTMNTAAQQVAFCIDVILHLLGNQNRTRASLDSSPTRLIPPHLVPTVAGFFLVVIVVTALPAAGHGE
jgi:H+/Cl- antiporter ClcA